MRTALDRTEIRERYLQLDAANVADVLDELGHRDQGLSPELRRTTGARLAGWAYTIRGEAVPYDGAGDELKMQACQGIGPDEVSVWSGGGSGVCYFGELIALGMRQRGSTGALVDGGIRDSRWLEDMGFDVFARYRSAVQSIGRWKVTEWQNPVYLPGATTKWVVVAPGDFVFGDEDGAIVIPDALVEDVLERAEAMTSKEVLLREELSSGLSLADALEKFGHV